MLRSVLALAASTPLALFASIAWAETEATVSGLVEDSDGRRLARAGIAVTNKRSGAAISGAITDVSGRFAVAGLRPGEYVVGIHHAGFAETRRDVLISSLNSVYNLGVIRLKPDPSAIAQVEELVVVATPTVDVPPGATVMNMADNVIGSSGSVLDAVKSLPGVTIDQGGTINLRGSDRVPVLIDGKPSALTGYGDQSGLDTIPAANIERIEVITNPSARFDAGGMAGVINIVMKSNRKVGLHGDVGLSGAVGALQKRQPDIPSPLGSYSNNPRVIPSFNVSYVTDTAVYALLGQAIVRRDLPNNEFTSRFYDNGRERFSQIPENREQGGATIKGGADWSLASGDTLSLAGYFDWERHIDRARIPYLDENGGQRRYWFWKEDESNTYLNANLGYKMVFDDPGHSLTARLQYTRGVEDELYKLNEQSPVRNGSDQTHVIATEHIIPFTLDYVRPLGAGRLEAGVKLQKRWIPVTYEVIRGNQSVIYQGLGDHTEWSEDTYALYGNLLLDRANYTLEGGLRLEQTKVGYDVDPVNIYYARSDAYDYAKAFGNLRLTYKLPNGAGLSLFYNNRVDRPGEQELRVFPKYDDPELLKVGNPFLRPQFTRTIEAAYKQNFGATNISAAIFHRDIEGAFTRVYAEDTSTTLYEIINKVYANTGHSTQVGVELLASGKPTHGITLSGSVNAYRNSIDAHTIGLDFPFRRTINIEASEDITWDAKLNSTIKGPWGVELQFSASYYAPRNIAQGKQSARSSIDLGAKKALIGDKLELVLTATDVFNSFGVEQEVQGDGFKAIYQNFNQTQVVNLGLKYKF